MFFFSHHTNHPLFSPFVKRNLLSPLFVREGEGGLTGKPYRFLFVGRIEKVKGIDLLLESWHYLKREVQNVHLTVVGRGGMEEWVRSFINERDLGGLCFMDGKCVGRDISFPL